MLAVALGLFLGWWFSWRGYTDYSKGVTSIRWLRGMKRRQYFRNQSPRLFWAIAGGKVLLGAILLTTVPVSFILSAE
jgi:hypothetical protein